MQFQKMLSFFVDIFYIILLLFSKPLKDSNIKQNPLQNVVLIPGFHATPKMFKSLKKHLEKNSYKVYLPYFQRQHSDINKMTSQLKAYLKKNKIKNCILIGHSLGGIIALNFAYKNQNAIKIITIGTPLKGATLEKFTPNITSIKQLNPNKQLIKQLSNIKIKQFYSIASSYDEIVPFNSTKHKSAEHITINSIGHLRLLFDKKVFNTITKIIKT